VSDSRPSAGLLDTTVFIAHASGRPLDRAALPELQYVSAITAAELEAGVHRASDERVRSMRMQTWARVVELDLLDADLGAAHEWAVLRSRLLVAGRRADINDLWIAAIAKANDLCVVTQDDGFDVIAEHGGPEVIKV